MMPRILPRIGSAQFGAVIFDLDGTLIDSERLLVAAGSAALVSMGFGPCTQVLNAMIGAVNAPGHPELTAELGTGFDADAFDAAWDMQAAAMLATDIPCRPGAGHLLTLLAARGLPVAVATNSTMAGARRKLDVAGLGGFFADGTIFGRDSVPRPKPAPDMFLAAAARLGVAPEHCLVFEDSDVGTAGAVAAGMAVVLVPDQRQPRASIATLIAPSLLAGAHEMGLVADDAVVAHPAF